MRPSPGGEPQEGAAGDGAGAVDGVVLITVDSLRADAIGETTAPVLAELGERGVAFENAFARGNWTPFSFPSMLGSAPVFADKPTVGLPESPSLAESLAAEGVRTAGFDAANGFLTEFFGYDRGFDTFETFIDDGGIGSEYLAAHPTVEGWLQLATSPFRRFTRTVTESRPALATEGPSREPLVDISHSRDIERRSVKFLDSLAPDDRFFLWVHYMDTHTPYVPAPRHLKAVGARGRGVLSRLKAHAHTGLGRSVDEQTLTALRELYQGTVHQVDASIGRLLRALETRDRRGSTAVVVAGDHGEEFQEHGHLSHYPKLYDELVRVPLVFDVPGQQAHDVETPVGLDGIPATVRELMGLPVAPFDDETGSLRGALEGEPYENGPVTAVALRGETVTQQPIPRRLEEGELLISARDGRYTYVQHTDTERTEWYDRSTDPSEQTPIGPGEIPPGPTERLERAVDRRLAGITGAEASPDAATPDALAVQLEALGYR